MIETSIVIRAFNEEKHLPALFDALGHQTYRAFDVTVVDSGSIDRTPDIARARANRLIRIQPNDFTFGHSLNVGIENTSGQFIVIASAHTVPMDDNWLRCLIDPLRDERIAMVYGRQRGRSDSKFSESMDFERIFGLRRITQKPPNFFANNANSAVRRDLWMTHAFDEALPGLEDIEWAKYWMERDYQVVYEPAAGVYHIHAETWAQVRRRFYREGQAAKWIGIRHRCDLPAEVLREGQNLLGDLAEAVREGKLRRSGEITRFRLEKLRGTINGIWDGAIVKNPWKPQKIDKHYNAVVIHGPGRASFESFELPSIKPGDVVIRVAYEGVCGTDLEILDGSLGYYKKGDAHYPIVPGHEFSGRAVHIGANVKGIAEGDRVIAECIQSCNVCSQCIQKNWTACKHRRELGVIGLNGAYSEYVVVPGKFVHRITDDIPLKHASLCEPIAVILKGLKRLALNSQPGKSKRCAVIGAGPIGHLCAQILALRGHKVVAVDCVSARLDHFAETGIATVDNLDDLRDFDVLIDATGNAEVLDKILRNSGPGSVLLLLGLPYAKCVFNFEALVSYDKTIVGSVGSSSEDFEEALRILPRLKLAPFTQKFFTLEEFDRAWTAFRQRTYLKIQLAIDEALDD